MPNRNGKGPMGNGPGSGRGSGRCSSSQQSVELQQQEQYAVQLPEERQGAAIGCRGPRGCGEGRKRGNNGCGNGRGNRHGR